MNTVHDSFGWEPACVDRHMGLWLYEPTAFRSMAALMLRTGSPHAASAKPKTVFDGGPDDPVLYRVADGLGMVQVAGPMQKFDSKFGGTNTVRTRRALRAMAADKDVEAGFLLIDSGGGTLAGTEELGEEVRRFASMKPIAAHADDLMASAALWIGAQASRVTANPTAMVGSIGAVSVVYDTSGKAEADGIKVHVLASRGAEALKGGGTPGAPITDEHLAHWQGLVDATNEHFLSALAAGRAMPLERVRELATGRVWMAEEARTLGLIDAVETAEQSASAVLGMAERGRQPVAATGRPRALAEALVRLAELG